MALLLLGLVLNVSVKSDELRCSFVSIYYNRSLNGKALMYGLLATYL